MYCFYTQTESLPLISYFKVRTGKKKKKHNSNTFPPHFTSNIRESLKNPIIPLTPVSRILFTTLNQPTPKIINTATIHKVSFLKTKSSLRSFGSNE